MNTHTLPAIASRIEAAALLLHCSRWMQLPDHRPITDTAVRSLRIYVEAIRAANLLVQCQVPNVSQALRDDLVIAIPGAQVCDMSLSELLDGYVACHLGSVVSAVRVVATVYLEDDNRPHQKLGEALYESLHWIEVGRHQLEALIARLPIEQRMAA